MIAYTHRFRIRAASVTIVAAFACLSLSAQAQTPAAAAPADSVQYGWKHHGTGMLNLSQAYYDEWAKGGTDALAYELNLGGTLAYEQADFTWVSQAKAIYGRAIAGGVDSRN